MVLVLDPQGDGVVPVRAHKKGIRAFGVAESFVKGRSRRSVVAGVVMRADGVLDGFGFATVAVGGMDATPRICAMFDALNRDDVNLVLLNGCVISWYNVIDLHHLAAATGLPVICVTYEPSEGLGRYFREYFPDDWQRRMAVCQRNGPRTPLTLRTGHVVYARFLGLREAEARGVLNKFTAFGSVPEPLRVARLIARSLMRSALTEGREAN
jgi:endonuclease V-like protein UPF0215 family